MMTHFSTSYWNVGLMFTSWDIHGREEPSLVWLLSFKLRVVINLTQPK